MRGAGGMTPREAKAIAVAQDAYGIWNTGPAWNRYHALRRAEQGPVRRFAVRVWARVLEALILAVSWGLMLAPLVAWWL